MDVSVSENSFHRGLSALGRGALVEALAYFEAALQLARRQRLEPIPMRYLSYYGWCLAACSGDLEEARQICEAAVRGEFYNPDLHWNLGRVYLRSGDRLRAFGSFVRGLQLNPRHMGLVMELRRLGIRGRPVVPFFSRRHPLNRMLGRLKRRLERNARPARTITES